MAGFPDEASVSVYLDLVDEYLTELAAAGLSVVPTEAIPVHRPGRPPVVYLVQPRMESQTLGHKHAARDRRRGPGHGDGSGARLGRPAVPAQRRTDGRGRGGPRRPAVELVVPSRQPRHPRVAAVRGTGCTDRSTPTQPVLIDVGTPFIRRNGRHSLDARVILAAAPPGIRALLLRFVADSYQDDYFVPRTVALDLLGNFHKEGAPETDRHRPGRRQPVAGGHRHPRPTRPDHGPRRSTTTTAGTPSSSGSSCRHGARTGRSARRSCASPTTSSCPARSPAEPQSASQPLTATTRLLDSARGSGPTTLAITTDPSPEIRNVPSPVEGS